jgi:hypothetical protein
MLERYYRISQVAGVSIHFKPEGTAVFNCCSISASGNRLDIDQKLPDMLSVEELNKHLPSKIAIALNLSGKGILHKQVEKIIEVNQGNFSKILPNGNMDDFYVQNFISGDWSFVSIIRKTDADKWIAQLKHLNFIPLSLSLGPYPIEHILPQLNVYGDDIQFNGNIIERNDRGEWKSCRFEESAFTPFALKVESEVIDEKLVIPYASAFQLILASKLDMIQTEVPLLNSEFRNKLNDQKLKVNGSLILFSFFVLLLINFVLFSQLNASNSNLASQVSRFARNTSSAQDIDDQIRKKEGLLESIGWEEGINKSALIDQLAALMPAEITLKEVAIDPIDLNTSRIQRSLLFFNRRIRINGTSDKIVPVNEWMARIKTRPWVKNLQMGNYTYNNELNTGQFTIILDY